jgi:hypothetical protein
MVQGRIFFGRGPKGTNSLTHSFPTREAGRAERDLVVLKQPGGGLMPFLH